MLAPDPERVQRGAGDDPVPAGRDRHELGGDVDAAATVAIIKELVPLVTAVGVIVVAVLQYLQRGKVDAVRTDLAANSAATDRKLEGVIAHTNGMKDQLVKEVRAASFAAGQKSETDKHQGA